MQLNAQGEISISCLTKPAKNISLSDASVMLKHTETYFVPRLEGQCQKVLHRNKYKTKKTVCQSNESKTLKGCVYLANVVTVHINTNFYRIVLQKLMAVH